MSESTPSQTLPPPSIPYATAAPDKDGEHLRLLSLFHYIAGGLIALFACFGFIHIFFGVMMLTNPNFFATPTAPGQPPGSAPAPQPPDFAGWMFIVMGGFVVLLGWSEAALTVVSGRLISQRRGWMFSIVVAGINCLWMPIGTILGIFTFLVLLRPTVKAMYERNKSPAPG